ncbi:MULTISPECIES: ATP-grasp domain-containing protein [unclassified Streptomyces]|uniref:ATP-grasp domain-containing protein n=1 Tax=unclassified Streptomyces TaxID=2593676 RepID=UPI0022B73A54|nr:MULTISPECIES: ATP-grasp domain-containing protein [unclassified Streptomyces]MCZ7416242.1 ATP-grasp domain-containing protein [Streptomyces sp. WMMC897]MCZ7433948.1 ATP-grasp domain-containing protein [Streptomyces sp. WMMC1477]
MTRPAAVIVDPFGSGSHLAPFFDDGGWDSVAVFSSSTTPESFLRSFRPEHFREVVRVERDGPSVAERLRGLPVVAVLPGTETGVELADELAEFFGVPGNSTEFSGARRDKAAMADRLRACGVPAPDHVVGSDPDVMATWAERRGRWPVVVKPRDSAGSDGVAVCEDAGQVRAAVQATVGTLNRLGLVNESVLCQEFLDGQQYLVNSVSVDGSHRVGEIWKFDSFYSDGHQIYDRQRLLPAEGPLQDRIVSYTHDVLDALDIRYGAAHTEVMLTERGLLLIETAARTTGLIEQRALNAAVGHHHISLTAEAYLTPERLLRRPPRYTLHRELGILALRSPVDGRIRSGPALEKLLALPAFAGIRGGALEPGTPVQRTRDLLTCPGLVYLLADTWREVEETADAIRAVEASGDLYEPDPGPRGDGA